VRPHWRHKNITLEYVSILTTNFHHIHDSPTHHWSSEIVTRLPVLLANSRLLIIQILPEESTTSQHTSATTSDNYTQNMSESFCGSIKHSIPSYNSHDTRHSPTSTPTKVHTIPSLDELLHQDFEDTFYNRANFVTYLSNIHCLENLEFILDLNEYLQKKTHEDWLAIYEKFLKTNAPSEINLPYKLRELLCGNHLEHAVEKVETKEIPTVSTICPGPSEETLVKVKRFVYDDILINLYNEFVKHMKGKSGECVYRRRSDIDTSLSKVQSKDSSDDEIHIASISRHSTKSLRLSKDKDCRPPFINLSHEYCEDPKATKNSKSSWDSPTEMFRGSSIFSRRVSRDAKNPEELYRGQSKYSLGSEKVSKQDTQLDPQSRDNSDVSRSTLSSDSTDSKTSPDSQVSIKSILTDAPQGDSHRDRRSRRSQASTDFSHDPQGVQDLLQQHSLRKSRSPNLVDLRRSQHQSLDRGNVGHSSMGSLNIPSEGHGSLGSSYDPLKGNFHEYQNLIPQSDSLLFILKPSLSSSQYYHDLPDDDDDEDGEAVVGSRPTARSNSSSSRPTSRGSSIGSIMDSLKNNVEGIKLKNVRKFKFSRRFSNDN